MWLIGHYLTDTSDNMVAQRTILYQVYNIAKSQHKWQYIKSIRNHNFIIGLGLERSSSARHPA